MNILILMPIGEQRGGAEQLLRMLLGHTDETALDVSVVFLEDGPLPRECRKQGIPTQVVPAGRLRHLHRFLPTVRQIVEAAEQTQADLIFSWMAKAHLYGAIASQMAGVPSAWYQHGLPRNTAWLNRLVSFFPTDGILACSETVADVQRQHWTAPPTTVVPPSVSLDQFNPTVLPSTEQARRELGLPEHGPLIGMVGRLQRWKGMHTLVDAMPNILAHHPDAHAVIVGGLHAHEPGYGTTLDERIADRGLEDRVLRVGFQSNVQLWMQAMDVFVHASDHEPFGIVLIEAMALGTPVVAGDRGGPTEIITEGTDGLLAPYEDAEALARQIRRYLDDPDFARTVGTNARRRAQDFGPEAYVERFANATTAIVRQQGDPFENVHQIFRTWLG